MKLDQAANLLRYLSENQLGDVHVIVQIPEGRKIGELMPGIKKRGYTAMVQCSARSDREIIVTEMVGNENA